MLTALGYLVLVLLPAVLFLLARRVLVRALGRRARSAPAATGAPAATAPSLARLTDDLRRIEREYVAAERSDAPGRVTRMRALALAYDDTLRACCGVLGLPAPDRSPLRPLVRLETELALVQRGVTW